MSDERKRDEYSSYWARWKFAKLAVPMRERARSLGYNLVTHGSIARDIDMIAIPWTDTAVPREHLVSELIKTMRLHNNGVAFMRSYQPPSNKPHGRRAYTIFVEGTYFDLSIMPTTHDLERKDEEAGQEASFKEFTHDADCNCEACVSL